MDFLSKNLDWLEARVQAKAPPNPKAVETVFIFDFPGGAFKASGLALTAGQIELFMTNESTLQVIRFIGTRLSTKSLVVQLFDSFFSNPPSAADCSVPLRQNAVLLALLSLHANVSRAAPHVCDFQGRLGRLLRPGGPPLRLLYGAGRLLVSENAPRAKGLSPGKRPRRNRLRDEQLRPLPPAKPERPAEEACAAVRKDRVEAFGRRRDAQWETGAR